MTAARKTRRGIIGLLAGGASSLAIRPAQPAAEPDSELLALGRQLARLRQMYEVACSEEWRLAIIYDKGCPARPAALYERGDNLGCGWANDPVSDGCSRLYYDEAQVDRLRGQRQIKYCYLDEAGETRVVESPEGQARADAVIAAFDAWDAERAAWARECGLTAAEERADELREACEALFDRMLKIEAATLPGLAALVAAARLMEMEAEASPRILDGVLRGAAAAVG